MSLSNRVSVKRDAILGTTALRIIGFMATGVRSTGTHGVGGERAKHFSTVDSIQDVLGSSHGSNINCSRVKPSVVFIYSCRKTLLQCITGIYHKLLHHPTLKRKYSVQKTSLNKSRNYTKTPSSIRLLSNKNFQYQ
jgi:hypothetical protein